MSADVLWEGAGAMPTVRAEPGCGDARHGPESEAWARGWSIGIRFSQPQVMACGCRLWVGDVGKLSGSTPLSSTSGVVQSSAG